MKDYLYSLGSWIEEEQFFHTEKLKKVFSNVKNYKDELTLKRWVRANRLFEEDLSADDLDDRLEVIDGYKQLIKEYEKFIERDSVAKIYKIINREN